MTVRSNVKKMARKLDGKAGKSTGNPVEDCAFPAPADDGHGRMSKRDEATFAIITVLEEELPSHSYEEYATIARRILAISVLAVVDRDAELPVLQTGVYDPIGIPLSRGRLTDWARRHNWVKEV